MNQPIGVHQGCEARYKVQVMESRRLRFVRKEAMSEIDPTFDKFSGTTEECQRLPMTIQDRLNDSVREDIRINPEAWEQTEKDIVNERPWAKNLILDSGLDFVCKDVITQQFTNCWVGTGNTPVVVDSGAVTATCSSHTVTASSSFFTAGMVGQLLNFDTGESRYITSYTDTTHVVLGGDELTIGTGTAFAVWAVNQTSLASVSNTTQNYFTGTGGCGYSDDSVTGTRNNFRTYDFSPQVSDQVFAELGWAPEATGKLWSRTLITGGTVTVVIGQQLRVIYQVFTTVTPHAPEAQTAAISGWPVSPSVNTDGTYFPSNPLVDQFAGLSSISSSGITVSTDTYTIPYVFEPSGGPLNTFIPMVCLTTSTTIPSFGSNYSPDPTNTAYRTSASLKPYVNGTFYRDADVYWQLSEGNRTDFRQILFASQAYASPYNWIAGFTFDQDQTKDDSHTLSITFRRSVGRILTNP